jgi:hypothetical protein
MGQQNTSVTKARPISDNLVLAFLIFTKDKSWIDRVANFKTNRRFFEN